MNSIAQPIEPSAEIPPACAEKTLLVDNSETVLKVGFHPCNSQPITSEPLVLLHGWGSDSLCWQAFAVTLNQYFDIHIIDLPGFGKNKHLIPTHESLLPLLPTTGIYLGWSLGGMLAVSIAHQYPQRVSALITLATNAQFSESIHWPWAMPAATFDAFKNNVQVNGSKTLKRFAQLVAASDYDDSTTTKQTLKRTRELYCADSDGTQFVPGLEWLQSIDNRDAYSHTLMPALHVFGSGDQLVPAAAVEQLRQLNQTAPVASQFLLKPGSHALHLEQTAGTVTAVVDFIQKVKPERSKVAVAKSFSDAADRYDAFAEFQRDVGNELLEKYRENTLDKNTHQVLDLGCGTGHFTSQLVTHNVEAKNHLCGLDLAEGMVTKARDNNKNATFIVGDAESLPIQEGYFQRVFSNLAIQWCENPAKLFSELYRITETSGHIYLSTLGPKSLSELKTVWQSIDNHQHVNQFVDQSRVTALAEKVGFQSVAITSTFKTVYFDDLKTLMREFKEIGAHNVNRKRAKGLSGKKSFQQLSAAYDTLKTESGLPLTYEVYYVHLIK